MRGHSTSSAKAKAKESAFQLRIYNRFITYLYVFHFEHMEFA